MARRSGVDGCRCLPLPGQQVVELVSLGPSGDDAFEDILEVGERLDGMELGGVVPVHGFETPICAYAATDIGLI